MARIRIKNENGEFQEVWTSADNELSSTSLNPVQNKAIYKALDNKVDKDGNKVLSTYDFSQEYKDKLDSISEGAGNNNIVIDTELLQNSTNPVQNKVVYKAINNLSSLIGDEPVSDQIPSPLDDGEIDAICGEFVTDNVSDITNAIDKVYLKKSGDTMSGRLNMNGYKVTGLATPTASTDAVNKEYVDNLSFSGSGSGSSSAVSPTVSVSKSGKVTTLKITDVNGTKTATINDGEDGVSPTVSVSKVNKVTTISITDKNGTKTATINDGEDGTGSESSDSRCTPQMFGAVGDGVTDDAAAMNSWFKHLADNNISGYIPNGTYLVKSGIGYSPSTASGKRISFVGESASQTVIKAGFARGTAISFQNCYLGEFGNLTIDNNESAPIEEGITGFQLSNMQYSEEVFSYIHDINIINIGQRAALIYNTGNNATNGVSPDRKSIEYVNMERVNVISCTSDRSAWLTGTNQYAPVGIIVADASHFHFINCTARDINSYPLEFKNYTEYCSHENCVIENCGHGIYLGQQHVPADTVCHMYYKAIGNTIKDVPAGVTVAKIAHSTFDNNTIIGLDGYSNACGFSFSAPCEYVTGRGNSYYGDKYAVAFRNPDNSYCHDNVIETAIYKSTFAEPFYFKHKDNILNSQRCTVIATNHQSIATTKMVDGDSNSFIPIANIPSAELVEASDNKCTPEAFGAVGNGTTDDTEAIRSCINYANENGLEVKFANGKKYKVNQKTSIVAHCSIDFNGATIILSGGSTEPFIKIEPLKSNKYTLSANSLTEYTVNDERLFNKCMTIVTPISLGIRSNSTSGNMPFTQTIKTDMNGNFINGKLECELVSGTYTINNVHDYMIQTLEIKNVTVDYSAIPDSDTAIFVNSYRSNVKFNNINIVGDMIINDWSYAVLGIYNSCNIELSNIRGNSPYSNGGSGYIVGLYEVSDVYMHDCDFGGSETQWGCMGISYISNFVAERVNTNRFDCHYYFTGYFTVRDCTTNLTTFCGGNGEVTHERVTFISLDNASPVKRRTDLDIMPSGIVKFSECTFEGGNPAFTWSCPSPNTDLLTSIKYDFTHFIFENCKVNTSNNSLAYFELSSGWDNVSVDIINSHTGWRTLHSYGESKVKRAIIRGCTFSERTNIGGCDEVVIKECHGDTVNVANTNNSCILCDNIFTPTNTTLIEANTAIIANNIILADKSLDNKAIKYVVANNLPLYDTYKSKWANASN